MGALLLCLGGSAGLLTDVSGSYGIWHGDPVPNTSCTFDVVIGPWTQPAPVAGTVIDADLTGLNFVSTNTGPQIFCSAP